MQLTRRAALTALLAPLLLVAGCNTNAPTQNGAASSQATGAAQSVRIAFFPNVTHAAALVGTGNGTFGRAFGPNVRVEERVFSAGPAEIEALFAGEVDLGYIGPSPAVNGYLKSGGQALKIIAGASSGGAALVARQGVAIASVKDLAGKRVAVPQTGGTQDISLRHALQTAGLASKDKNGTVDVLQFAPADTLNQFRQNTLDAAWVPEPWAARLEAEAGARVVLDERDLWPNHKFATTVVIVRADFLKSHPDLVQKFLTAHREAVQFIQTKPDEARKIIGDRLKELNKGKGLPDAVLKTALSRTDITDDPLPETVLAFADQAKALGYLRQDRAALADLFVSPSASGSKTASTTK